MRLINICLLLFLSLIIYNCNNDVVSNSPEYLTPIIIKPGFGASEINFSMSREQIESNENIKVFSSSISGTYVVGNCTTDVYYTSNKPTELLFRSGNIITPEKISLGSSHNDVYKAYGIPDTTSYESKATYTIHFKKRGISFIFNAIQKTITNINITKIDTTTSSVISKPTIIGEPSDTIVEIGETASFSILVTVSHFLDNFQWQKNGINIAGANLMTYITKPVQASDNGALYRCIVSNSLGSDTSEYATLYVKSAGNITIDTIYSGYGTKSINLQMSKQQIETVAQKIQNSNYNEYVFNGCSLTVFYNVNTPSGITYRSNVVTNKKIKIGSSYSSVINIYGTPDTTNNGTEFYTIVYYKYGIIFMFQQKINQVLQIAVMPADNNVTTPVITAQPTDKSVIAGETATFSIIATGDNLSYQWKRNGVSVGSNSNTYSYVTSQFNNNDSILCIVSNTVGNITSRTALLTVITKPTVSVNPKDVTVNEGQSASFSVTATGINLSYQWQKNGFDIPGATSSSYTTPLTTLSNNGELYRCVISNLAGSITSNSAILQVNSISLEYQSIVTQSEFPKDWIKEEWNKGYDISLISASTSIWVAVSSEETDYLQSWKTSTTFPQDWVEEQWDNDYYITSVNSNSNYWAVVMSKGADFTAQTWQMSVSFPDSWITKQWNNDYYITSIGSNSSQWVVVMSEREDFTNQTWKTSSTFPNDWIKEQWNNDYYITAISSNSNLWAIVMSEGTGYSDQTWKTSSTFPTDWIKEQWNEKYLITSITNHNGTWAVVMSK